MSRPKRVSAEAVAPFVYDADVPGPIDWPTLFGNGRPVEIEVGYGKGMFLSNAGTACPEVNFFGVEVERKFFYVAADRLASRNLTNVRACCADAKALLRDRVADASVQTVHVYFPDPWWKRRHHKRRLFTPDFAETCVRILIPGGRLSLATDVEDYFHMVRETMAPVTAMTEVPPPAATEGKHDLDYLTNFERKFRIEGRPIYRVAYEKRAA